MKLLKYTIFIFLFISCSNENDELPFLQVDQNNLVQSFESEASSVSFPVKSNGVIVASSSSPDWCLPKIEKGENANILTISVTNNISSDIRSAQIVLKVEGAASITIRVSQLGSTLRFAVISDTHFGLSGATEKVTKALNNILSKTPQLDALFVVGDLTDSGLKQEYEELIKVFGKQVPSTVSVYYMLGNHDWASNISGAPDALFTKMLNQPVNQFIEIKGYPFITVSTSNFYEYPNHYNSQANRFLSESLAKASKQYPGLPIFVFAHVGAVNTVYGTGPNEGWGVNALLPALIYYPQVILFSGHSHFPIGDPRSIHQNYFTSVNDGNTSYSEIESGFTEGVHPSGYNKVTEGIIASAKKNGDIELQRWDTYRNEEILPKWIVKAPHTASAFTYIDRDGGTAPAFKENDKVTVSNITTNSCQVSFPQATDDEVVHHYVVDVMENNQIVKTVTVFSQFYLNSEMPKVLSTNITGLKSGSTYSAQVRAVDSFNKESKKIESVEFLTGS